MLIKILLRLTALTLVVTEFNATAAPKGKKPRLTPARLAELAAKPEAEPPKICEVAISDYGSITVKLGQQAALEKIREFRYPTEFDPPQGSDQPGNIAVTPTTPTAFETTNAGWSVEVTVKTQGKVFDLSGMATFTEVEFVNGGYGELAGPVYTEDGAVLTPNVLQQPKIKTTSTRFKLYALPGQPYEVIFYRGDKAEKRTITITGAMAVTR